jgi:hypothetical protein
MIEPAHDLPVARQAKVLNLSRSSVYYRPTDRRLRSLTQSLETHLVRSKKAEIRNPLR